MDLEVIQRDVARDGRFLVFSTGPFPQRPRDVRDVLREGQYQDGLPDREGGTPSGTDAEAPVGPNVLRCHRPLYCLIALGLDRERTLKRKLPETSLTEALGLLENVWWVRSDAGKSTREGVPQLAGRQKEILSALDATRYLPVG